MRGVAGQPHGLGDGGERGLVLGRGGQARGPLGIGGGDDVADLLGVLGVGGEAADHRHQGGGQRRLDRGDRAGARGRQPRGQLVEEVAQRLAGQVILVHSGAPQVGE